MRKASPPYMELGIVYLAIPLGHREGENTGHLIYKLHNVGTERQRRFRWIAMWNSVCHHSPFEEGRYRVTGKRFAPHKTIEAAIKWVHEGPNGGRNYEVVELFFGELIDRRILRKVYKAAGTKL